MRRSQRIRMAACAGFALLVALSVTVLPQSPAAPAGAATLRIIVLESEDEARRVREELMRGANFTALATARSVDPSAAVRTVVIDRGGRLLANVEGNRFTAQQLGDLVNAALNR